MNKTNNLNLNGIFTLSKLCNFIVFLFLMIPIGSQANYSSDFHVSFSYTASNIADVRKFTHFHLIQSVKDLSHRWDVNFLNQQEYIKIVKALEVFNAILLYQTPILTKTVIEYAQDSSQFLERLSNSSVENKAREKHFVLLYHPRGFSDHNYNFMEACFLEESSQTTIKDSCLHLPLISSFDPSTLNEIEEANKDSFYLARSLGRLLEKENVPEGESVSLYLRNFNIQKGRLEIGVLTNQRQYKWKLNRKLKIESLKVNGDDYFLNFAARIIREQIPLAVHEASHELVRRFLLAEITGPLHITLFPKVFKLNSKFVTINGLAGYSNDVAVPVFTQQYILSYMAQALVGQVVSDVFGDQFSAEEDRQMARHLAYHGILCLGYSNLLESAGCPVNSSPEYFDSRFLDNLDVSQKQAVETEVSRWIESATSLAQHIVLDNFEVLMYLTNYVLTKSMMTQEQIIDFYNQYPVRSINDIFYNKRFKINIDNFQDILRSSLENTVKEIADSVIRENTRKLHLVPINDQIPLASDPEWLERRHRMKVKEIGDILLETWTENIQLFTEYPFHSDLQLLEQLASRHRKWYQHLTRPASFIQERLFFWH